MVSTSACHAGDRGSIPGPGHYYYYFYTIILHKSVCLSVGVRKLQVAILAPSSREMTLTDRILSRVHVEPSVRPSSFFIREKLPNNRGNRVASTCCLFQ